MRMRPTTPEITKKTPEQISSQSSAVNPNTFKQQPVLSQTVTADSNNPEQRPSASSQTIVDPSSETCETIGEQIAYINALIKQYQHHTTTIEIKLPPFITNQFTAVAVAKLEKIKGVFTATDGDGLCSALETAKKNLERTRQSLDLKNTDSLTITAATLKRAIRRINFYKNKKHKRKLMICGVTVNDDLDLSTSDYGDLSGDAITIENTAFNGTVNFSQCRLHNAKFPGCIFKKDVIVDGADIRGVQIADVTFAADVHSTVKTIFSRDKKNKLPGIIARSNTYEIAGKKKIIHVRVFDKDAILSTDDKKNILEKLDVCSTLQVSSYNADEIWNKIYAAHQAEVKKDGKFDALRRFFGKKENIIARLNTETLRNAKLTSFEKINKLLLHVQKDPKSRSFKAIHTVINNYVKSKNEAAVNTQQNGRETSVPELVNEHDEGSPLTVRAATSYRTEAAATQQHAQTSQDDERQPLTTRSALLFYTASLVSTQVHHANLPVSTTVTPTQNNNSGNAHALASLTTVTTTPARVIPHVFFIPPIFTSSVPLSLIRLALNPVSENTYSSVYALASTVASSIIPSTVANVFPETVPHRPRALTQSEPVTSSSSPTPPNIAMIKEKTPEIIELIQVEEFNDASNEIHALVKAMKTDDFLSEQIFFSSSIFADLRAVIKSEIGKLSKVETVNDARFAALCNFNQSELVQHIQRGDGHDAYQLGEPVTRQLQARQNNITSGALPFTAALARIIDGLFPEKEIKNEDLLILQKHIGEKIRWVGEDFALSSHVAVGKLEWATEGKALTMQALQNMLRSFYGLQDAKSAIAKVLYDIFPTSDDPSVEFPLDFTQEKFDKMNRAAYQAEVALDLIKKHFTPIWMRICAHDSVECVSDDGIIQVGLETASYPKKALANQFCNKCDLDEPDTDVNYSKYLYACEIQAAIAKLKTAAPHNIAQEFLKVRMLLANASEKIKFETRGGPGTLFTWGPFVTELDNAFSVVTEAELTWREQVPVVLPTFREIALETKTKKGAIVLSRFEQLKKLIAKQKTQYVYETVADSTNGNARASERAEINAMFEPIFAYMRVKIAEVNKPLHSKLSGETASEPFQTYQLSYLNEILGNDAFKYQACYQLQQLQEEICGENGVLNRNPPDVDIMLNNIFADVKEALEALKKETHLQTGWITSKHGQYFGAIAQACKKFNEFNKQFSETSKKSSDLSSISDISDDVSSTSFTSRESRASSLIPVAAASSSSANDNATSVISPSHLFGKTSGAPTQAEANGNEIVRIIEQILNAVQAEFPQPIDMNLFFQLKARLWDVSVISAEDKRKIDERTKPFHDLKLVNALGWIVAELPSTPEKIQTHGTVATQLTVIFTELYQVNTVKMHLKKALQPIFSYPAFLSDAFTVEQGGYLKSETEAVKGTWTGTFTGAGWSGTHFNAAALVQARALHSLQTKIYQKLFLLSENEDDINYIQTMFTRILQKLSDYIDEIPQQIPNDFLNIIKTAYTHVQAAQVEWEKQMATTVQFASLPAPSNDKRNTIKKSVREVIQPIFDIAKNTTQRPSLIIDFADMLNSKSGYYYGPQRTVCALTVFDDQVDRAQNYSDVASALQKLLAVFAAWESKVDFPQFKTAYASLKAIAASPLYQMPKVSVEETRRMAVTK